MRLDALPWGATHRLLTSLREDPSVHTRRDLTGSFVAIVAAVVALGVFPAATIEVPAAVVLVVALPVLTRSAIRLAANPARSRAGPRHD